MWSTLKETVVALVGSKKFTALVAGLIASLIMTLFGARLGLTQEQAADYATKIVALAASYLLAQGAADLGKEKKAP